MMVKLILYILSLLIFSITFSQSISYKHVGKMVKLKSGKTRYYDIEEFQYGVFGGSCDEAVANRENTSFELFGNVVLWDTSRIVRSDKATLTNYRGKYRVFLNGNIEIDQDSVQINGRYGRYDQLQESVVFNDSVVLRYSYPELSIYNEYSHLDIDRENLSIKRIHQSVVVDSMYKGVLKTPEISYNHKSGDILFSKRVRFDLFKHTQDMSEVKGFNHQQLLMMDNGNFPHYSVFGNRGKGNMKREEVSLYGSVKLSFRDSNEVVTLLCDTLDGDMIDKSFHFRNGFALYNDSLSIKGDSGILDYNNQILKVYGSPKLSFKNNLASGDSCYIKYGENRSIEYVSMYGKGVIENPVENTPFTNLIEGRFIKIFFNDNRPQFLQVNREAICTYYKPPDVGKTEYQRNRVSGDTLRVDFMGGEISDIELVGGVRGEYQFVR